jgi:hypothetical protein
VRKLNTECIEIPLIIFEQFRIAALLLSHTLPPWLGGREAILV